MRRVYRLTIPDPHDIIGVSDYIMMCVWAPYIIVVTCRMRHLGVRIIKVLHCTSVSLVLRLFMWTCVGLLRCVGEEACTRTSATGVCVCIGVPHFLPHRQGTDASQNCVTLVHTCTLKNILNEKGGFNIMVVVTAMANSLNSVTGSC